MVSLVEVIGVLFPWLGGGIQGEWLGTSDARQNLL